MSSAVATGRPAFDVLRVGRRIAAELSSEAVDPAAALTMTDRLALAALSLAVDVEVSRCAGVEPCTAQARARLAHELASIEASRPPKPTP